MEDGSQEEHVDSSDNKTFYRLEKGGGASVTLTQVTGNLPSVVPPQISFLPRYSTL